MADTATMKTPLDPRDRQLIHTALQEHAEWLLAGVLAGPDETPAKARAAAMSRRARQLAGAFRDFDEVTVTWGRRP